MTMSLKHKEIESESHKTSTVVIVSRPLPLEHFTTVIAPRHDSSNNANGSRRRDNKTV